MKKHTFLFNFSLGIAFTLFSSVIANAQVINVPDPGVAPYKAVSADTLLKLPPEVTDSIYVFAEEKPMFGTNTKLDAAAYFEKNLRYPKEAKAKAIQATVIVDFVVERDGSLSSPRVAKDINGLFGGEALRLLKGMPTWQPGKSQGVPIRVRYALPVRFKL
jgi:protein TonB